MRIFLSLIFILVVVAGCEPKSPDPYLNPSFPDATFNFSVYPEDSVLHVGDTITFSAAIGNTFGNTVLTDGSINLGLDFGGSNHIPIIDSLGNFSCYNGEQYTLISYAGTPYFGTHIPSPLSAYNISLENDSFKIKFSFVMLKKGLYEFSLDAGSLTSSKGKTGIDGVFNVMNHHWNFFQVPGIDTPMVGTYPYNSVYFFAVE
ncbi:MAG TPA: hypothetical protein VN721_14080 [Flavipsychrobacter sp.]|nr:hypothetical protein [Flavipsychrobacter sp.]